MVALNFPASPTVGQVYSGYVWDGEKWMLPAGGAANVGSGAFAANRNGVNQTGLTAANYNKIIFNNEVRDQNGWYDPVLGRYTPQVAGLYFFVLATFASQGTSGETSMANVYKNGVTALKGAFQNISSSTTGFTSIASGCLYMNGTTDYVEAWVYLPAGQTVLVGVDANSHFEGFRVEDPLNAIQVPNSKKNYIINGAMQVSQEWGNMALSAAGFHAADMFYAGFSHGGAQTLQQIPNVSPGGSPNRLRCLVTTADAAVAAGDYSTIGTKIEGLRAADLKSGSTSAKTITIRFGCKGPAGTYYVGIENLAQNRSYPAAFTISAAEANTDVLKTVTLQLDQVGTWAVDNTACFNLFWTLMAGTTYQGTANSWQAGNFFSGPGQFNFLGTVANVFELFDVGLYEGPAAPPYVVPDFASELALCKRYYETTYPYGQANVRATMTGVQNMPKQSTAAIDGIRFQVDKRAAPTFTLYSPISGASGVVYDNGVGDTIAAVDSIAVGGCRIYTTGPMSAANCYFQWVASARL